MVWSELAVMPSSSGYMTLVDKDHDVQMPLNMSHWLVRSPFSGVPEGFRGFAVWLRDKLDWKQQNPWLVMRISELATLKVRSEDSCSSGEGASGVS
jgi:hypothetical protein